MKTFQYLGMIAKIVENPTISFAMSACLSFSMYQSDILQLDYSKIPCLWFSTKIFWF